MSVGQRLSAELEEIKKRNPLYLLLLLSPSVPTMERKRKVDLGDDDPSPAAAAAGTSGSDSARKKQANGGGENGGGGGGENGHSAAAKNNALLRQFDETAKVSPYTGREYSKKYFDILEKRKG